MYLYVRQSTILSYLLALINIDYILQFAFNTIAVRSDLFLILNAGCNVKLQTYKLSVFVAFFCYCFFFIIINKEILKLISDVGQRTTPAELPIYGDPYTEIALELIFAKENPNFLLNGKTLQLLKPLDRDQDNLSHIVFQVYKLVILSLMK